jgi:hypothetical protein
MIAGRAHASNVAPIIRTSHCNYVDFYEITTDFPLTYGGQKPILFS